MLKPDRCKHWSGLLPLLHGGDFKCAAGVDMRTVSTDADKVTLATLPCIAGKCPEAKCGQFALPTAEEVARDEEEARKLIVEACEHVEKADAAIVAKIGKWKRGMPGVQGTVDCPVCGGKDTLVYSRSGYNGHTHGHCSTPDCVSWME